MLSQSEKLLVVGDSNVGMMKNLYDKVGELLEFKDIEFWYQTGSPFNTISISEGWISSKTPCGLPSIYFKDFRRILFVGGRLRVIPVFEQIMDDISFRYSDRFIAAAVKDYVTSLPGFGKLIAIRNQFSGPITVVTTPLRGSMNNETPPDKPEARQREIYNYIWKCYRSAFDEIECELLYIPYEATVGGYLINSMYNLQEGDDLHKNYLYAKLILDQFKEQRALD